MSELPNELIDVIIIESYLTRYLVKHVISKHSYDLFSQKGGGSQNVTPCNKDGGRGLKSPEIRLT